MSSTVNVLLVDDDPTIAEVVHAYLTRSGIAVQRAADGVTALAVAARTRPDLVVLDLMLPGLSGLDVCRRLREARPDLPVVMLTALGEESDRILGLETGADDYLVKPFSPRELVLRVQAILRRGGPPAAQGVISYGGGELGIDEPQRLATVRGTAVALTPTEWGVLVALATVPGRVYSRFELINRVRGYEFEGYERTVDSHVKNLRRKVEDDPGNPRIVQTVLGGGYRLGLTRDD